MTDSEARAIALEAAELVYAKTRAEFVLCGKDPKTKEARDAAFIAANDEYTKVYVQKVNEAQP